VRSVRDRIRHAISFEIIALVIVTPAGAWLFGFHMVEIGVVAAGSAAIATIWNYIYNLGFDHALRWRTGDVRKSLPVRVFHAVLFEAGLLTVLLPFIAWYLGVSLLEAFLMDVSFAAFFVVYAFAFNWLYDLVFPLSAQQTLAADQRSATGRLG